MEATTLLPNGFIDEVTKGVWPSVAQAEEGFCCKSRGDGVRVMGYVAKEEVVVEHVVKLEVA